MLAYSCLGVQPELTAAKPAALPPFPVVAFRLLLPLSILQHNHQNSHKDCNKINKEVKSMLDVVSITMLSSLYNHLQCTETTASDHQQQ